MDEYFMLNSYLIDVNLSFTTDKRALHFTKLIILIRDGCNNCLKRRRGRECAFHMSNNDVAI